MNFFYILISKSSWKQSNFTWRTKAVVYAMVLRLMSTLLFHLIQRRPDASQYLMLVHYIDNIMSIESKQQDAARTPRDTL